MAKRGGFTDRAKASEAGKRGAATVRAERGSEWYQKIGRMGGAANKRKHGSEHFQELGRRGAEKRWGREGGSENGQEVIDPSRGG